MWFIGFLVGMQSTFVLWCFVKHCQNMAMLERLSCLKVALKAEMDKWAVEPPPVKR